MSKIICIGDAHGYMDRYEALIQSFPEGTRTIQLGDMGIRHQPPPMPLNHRWIRGNHDNPQRSRLHPNYLGDFGYIPEDHLFFLGGAYSIDYMMRAAGVNWFQDEELTWPELQTAVDLYKQVKPRFVVSHDGPSHADVWLLTAICGGFRPEKLTSAQSRTASAMQVMFEAHQPEEWVFGHYHVDKSFNFKGTKFTCVNELSTYELDTDQPLKTGMIIG